MIIREARDRSAGAVYSPCERYRYRLWRLRRPAVAAIDRGQSWEQVRPCLFIMLNPSTATELVLDPTVRSCQTRATLWGHTALEVVNLFAYRSTDPQALYEIEDPVGPDNDEMILECAARAARIVVAWGNHGAHRGRGEAVLARLRAQGLSVQCLRRNRTGHPMHPLYVSMTAEPVDL